MSENEISFSTRVKSFCFTPFVFSLAFLFGYLHYYHVSTMFENIRHFSHLSTLEREMVMKTELGFYYSYYKTIVEANSFTLGAKKVMNDKLVEYPDTVNALRRFNVYPEVISGYLFYAFSHYCNAYKIENKQCWSIKRNGHMNDVISCEGLGEPIYFYLTFTWLLAGLTAILIFVFGLYLSKGLSGGLAAVLCFFYNHGEATRIQWSPPLRENFAFPFILLQMIFVTLFLRRMTVNPTEINILQIWILGISVCVCLILWQFSQFVLMTQLTLLFIMEQLKIVSSQLFFLLLSGHLIGIYLAVIVMQGNKMLMSSFYLAMTCSMSLNYILWNHFLRTKNNTQSIGRHILHFAKNCIVVLSLIVIFKLQFTTLVGSEDDSHIIELLRTKFTSFKNFHTMLYTCSSEFDFLPLSTIWNLSTTLLLPSVVIVIILVFRSWILTVMNDSMKSKGKSKKKSKTTSKNLKISGQNESDTPSLSSEGVVENKSKVCNRKSVQKTGTVSKSKIKPTDDNTKDVENRSYISAFIKVIQTEPEIVYNLAQLAVFTVMACIIMRLKLFLTPQLCVVFSLLSAKRYFIRFGKTNSKLVHTLMFFVILVGMSIKGVQNISKQRSMIGEFSNEPLEELLIWIDKNTEKTAAFAGPMPLTSAIMLSTRRPIVNHPHYEDASLRSRTMLVYSMFSRQKPIELYDKLSKLKVTYLVLNDLWCFYKSARGCTMLDIWDVEEPHLKDNDPLCPHLYLEKSVPHFQRVFSNSRYVVLKLHDNAINIKFWSYQMHSM